MKNNWIIVLFGFSLFLLVMTVLHTLIFLTPEGLKGNLEVFAPFIVLSGFFIFLIGAMLVALSFYRMLENKIS